MKTVYALARVFHEYQEECVAVYTDRRKANAIKRSLNSASTGTAVSYRVHPIALNPPASIEGLLKQGVRPTPRMLSKSLGN